MNTTSRFLVLSLLMANFLAVPRAWAVLAGQIDTFEDGTTQGWTAGANHPAPPSNVVSGGPAGVNDNYLLLTALGGSGPGSRLSVQNSAQWAGNHVAAGVTAITMDLNNFGPSSLALRLVFEDSNGGPATNVAFSTNPILLPAGSGWTAATFPIGVSDLQAGLGAVNQALMTTTIVRLYHSDGQTYPDPFAPINPVVALLGVDNIRAGSSVPDGDPSSILLLSAALTVIFCRRPWARATARDHSAAR